MGNGSMVFLPSEEDENSERALSVLTEAMLAEEVVAIVRQVYPGIYRNKTMANKLIYIPKDNTQNYAFCR